MEPRRFTLTAGADNQFEHEIIPTSHFWQKLYSRILDKEKPDSSIQASLQRSVVIPMEERPPTSRVLALINGNFLRATYFYDEKWDALYVLVPDDRSPEGPIQYIRTVYQASHSGWFLEWKSGRSMKFLMTRKVSEWYSEKDFDGTDRKRGRRMA